MSYNFLTFYSGPPSLVPRCYPDMSPADLNLRKARYSQDPYQVVLSNLSLKQCPQNGGSKAGRAGSHL